MHISNSDFWILAGILSAIGSVGIYEGSAVHPAFYAQSAIIFGGLGYLAFKAFYLDRKLDGNVTVLAAPSEDAF